MPKTPAPAESIDSFDAAPLSDSLRALARRGVVQRLRRGTQIITEGDRGDTLYIVLSGKLRAFSTGDSDREVTYGVYGAGEYVGEMGLDGGLRSANVKTEQASVCVLITRTTLERHLAAEPAFAFELLAKVTRLARTATLGLRQVALNNVYGGLKALLDGLAQPTADGHRVVDPAPSQLEMSRQLGCSRVMVGRVLKDLQTGGYVQAERRRIVVRRVLPAKW